MSTNNADGSNQSTAIWAHLDIHGTIRTSLAKDRQKYRNLLARPHATLFSISPEDPFRTIEVRADVSFTHDPDHTFFAQLLALYGRDLQIFSAQAAEDRVVVSFHPHRIRT